jgi:hypothetical protein
VLEKRLWGPQAQAVSRGEGSTWCGNGGRWRHGYPRERNHPGFIADREAVGGASLHAKITESRYGPRQGRSTARGGGDMRRVRRRVVGWAARRAWTRGVRGVGEKGGGMAVHRTVHGPMDPSRPCHEAQHTMAQWRRRRCGTLALWSARVPTRLGLALFRQFFSNFPNRSGPSAQYLSCRSADPLQLLQ